MGPDPCGPTNTPHHPPKQKKSESVAIFDQVVAQGRHGIMKQATFIAVLLAAWCGMKRIPGLGIKSCPWLKDNAKKKQRTATDSSPAVRLPAWALTCTKVDNVICLGSLVHIQSCTQSSAHNLYDDLTTEETIQLAMLRADFQMVSQIVDTYLITWTLSDVVAVQAGALLGPAFGPFVHSTSTPFDRMATVRKEALLGQLLANAQTVSAYTGGGLVHLLHIPAFLCERLSSKTPGVLCTPHIYAVALGVEAQRRKRPLPAAAVASAPTPPADPDSGDSESEPDVGSSRRAPRDKFPIMAKLKIAEMMYALKSPDNLETIVELALGLVLPPDQYYEMKEKIRNKTIKLPTRSTVYLIVVKLDWLNMLYQRVLFSRTCDETDSDREWFSSQLGGDSSPQRTFNYMNQVEERAIFRGTPDDIANLAREVGPLKCFTLVRRTMPLQILGLGNSGTVGKFYNFAKSLMYEAGAELLPQRRDTVSGWLADQGTDIKLGDVANPQGSTVDIMRALNAGHIEWGSPGTKDGFFFPNSITIAEGLHAIFGALEDALKTSEAWPHFEPVLRDLTVTMGDKMFRDRFLEVCMQAADKWERKLFHNFRGHKFDWRWEVLEVITKQLSIRWPILGRYFDEPRLSNDGQLTNQGIGILHRALADQENDLPAVYPMILCTEVISNAVGHNARWLKGCDCHEKILLESPTVKKRDELMAAEDPSYVGGGCFWCGRRGAWLAHGIVETWCDNGEKASSPEYVEFTVSDVPPISFDSDY